MQMSFGKLFNKDVGVKKKLELLEGLSCWTSICY